MTQPPKVALSIVIPAYNEAARLGGSLTRVLDWLEKQERNFEIIVVDDGSRDATSGVAQSFSTRGVRSLRLAHNSGKGAAVSRGVRESKGDRVLLSDADFSTPIEELVNLESRIDEAPLVLGSRAVRGARILRHQPLYREVMGKTFNRLLRLFGVWGISDTQCGFKLLDGTIARELFSQIVTPGFAFDVELVWLARRAGHRVVEVGVVWEHSADSRVHLLTDPPRMIGEILRFRWQHRRRARRDPSSKAS